MRGRFGTGAVALWSFALNVALQKGWLDWCPDWGVALMLAIPIMTWAAIGLTHDTVKNYLNQTNRIVAIAVFIFVGALIGGAGGGVIYALLQRPSVQPSTAKPSAVVPRHIVTLTAQEIYDLLSRTGPFQKDDVAKEFIDGIVDWTLTYSSVEKLKEDPARIKVVFNPKTWIPPHVVLWDQLKGNEYLGRIEPGTSLFRVKGVISEIDSVVIKLIEASFEQLPRPALAQKPTPTPAIPEASVATNDVFAIFKGRTALQAAELLEPRKGERMEIAGKISQVQKNFFNEDSLVILARDPGGEVVGCTFDKKWRDKLRDYNTGDIIKVLGIIGPHQDGQCLQLSQCELR